MQQTAKSTFSNIGHWLALPLATRNNKIKYFQAQVVCRQLGFAHVESVRSKSYFGEVSQPFSYNDVICYGSESSLQDCFHSGLIYFTFKKILTFHFLY